MPARATVRTGLVSASALALALLAGSPALAANLGSSDVGKLCTTDDVLEATVSCEQGVVTLTTVPDGTTPSVAPTPPPPDPGTAAPPVVVVPPGELPPADLPPGEVPPEAPTATVPPAPPGEAGGPPASPPASPPPDPNVPGGSLIDNAKDNSKPGAVPASTPAPGKSLLQAAAVSTLASSDLPTLAAMNAAPLQPGAAGSPLSAYMPSPLLANLPPNAALAAVQAPLLAAADDAAGGGGFTLAGLDSKALPGLLVVLATALVAAVGAGNMRAWQERLPQWRRTYARARR